MKVFLADDSLVILERLKEMLLPISGIQVVGFAFDVPMALQSIRSTKPQVVILDLNMPGGSGIEVLQSIKVEAPETLVIILTNYGAPQYRRKCVDAGADAFLDKSTEITNVPQVLRQLGTRAGYLEDSPEGPDLANHPASKVKVG